MTIVIDKGKGKSLQKKDMTTNLQLKQ